MAKREISSTLRNLKFMQRSAVKEDKKKIIDEEPNGNFPPLGSGPRKCVVITDWDPQPGALLGRMSFQSFNPSIEKLNEEAINGGKTEAPASSSTSGGKMSSSDPGCSKVETSQETNGDLKRKQPEVAFKEPKHINKSPKSSDKASPSSNGFKKPKSKKVDWSVLKPPKPRTQKGAN